VFVLWGHGGRQGDRSASFGLPYSMPDFTLGSG
jgi:hypothetical protein